MRSYLFASVLLLIGSSSALAVDIFVDNLLGDDLYLPENQGFTVVKK